MAGLGSPIFRSVRHADDRRGATALRLVLLGLAALILLMLATGLALWRYANAQVDRIDLPALGVAPTGTDPDAAVDPIEGTRTFLVVGTDSRDGLSEEQLEQLGTEAIEELNTDTLILLQLSPERERVAMVSFPRDLKVPVPGNGQRRINAVHALGGADLLVATIRDYTGVTIDHYVEVNLAGFLQLTDALGGVDVCIEEPMVDEFAGVDLPAGCHTLDGVDAAGFVRSRRVRDEFGPDSDYGRINRQHYFTRQAMSKVTSLGTLLNPVKVKNLIDVVADAITTDRDLSGRLMLQLANTLKGFGPEQIDQRVVPSFYSLETGFGHPFPEQAEALFQALREGTPLPDVGLTGPRELVAADVSVQVLNGVGVEGLARRVADDLDARGFRIVDVANASSRGVRTTVIEHRPEDEAKAKLLAAQFPAQLRATVAIPVGIDVVLTLGQDQVEADATSEEDGA